MQMTTENDWHRIFVHDFIWECFHGSLKYEEEVLPINGNYKNNRLVNLKLNSNESRIQMKNLIQLNSNENLIHLVSFS